MSGLRIGASHEEQLALYCMALGYAMLFGTYPIPQAVLAAQQTKTKEGVRGGKRAAKPTADSFDPTSEPLPAVLDTAAFREAWAHRLEERASWAVEAPSKKERIVAKLTQRQVRGHLRDLAKVADLRGVDAAVRCCNRAENGHWQGVVYEQDLRPDTRLSGIERYAKPAPGSTSAQLARAAEIDEREPGSIWGNRTP